MQRSFSIIGVPCALSYHKWIMNKTFWVMEKSAAPIIAGEWCKDRMATPPTPSHYRTQGVTEEQSSRLHQQSHFRSLSACHGGMCTPKKHHQINLQPQLLALLPGCWARNLGPSQGLGESWGHAFLMQLFLWLLDFSSKFCPALDRIASPQKYIHVNFYSCLQNCK